MRRIWLIAAAALLVSAQSQAPAPALAPAPERDWRALAVQDVRAAYDLYAANHPGMHDPANPGFAAQLARARDRGLELAARASGQEGYTEALGAFSAMLADGHAQLGPVPLPPGTVEPREWPGFVAAWRGDRVLVHHAAAGFPVPAGAQLLGCDGREAPEFVRLRLENRRFRPAEAGGWWYWTPRAFFSSPSFRATRPQSCRFRTGGGEREVALEWRPAPDDFDALLAAATDGDRSPIALAEPRPGLFLIGMPSFNPDPAQVEQYRALFEALRTRRGDLQRARAVVIDLRHNNGGSSYWSRDAANILWGRPYVTRIMADYFKDVAIWWRASADNVAYMSEMEAQLRRNGQTEGADGTRRTGESMRAALTRGEAFFVERDEDAAAPPQAEGADRTDFAAPVYVITPGRCGSACLDAVDLFTRFPNVRLMGAPTSADSTYMEVRSATLPSGQGRIVIPNKLWSGRPRASGQVYTPHIPVDDLDWSTATFLDRVERDLAARP